MIFFLILIVNIFLRNQSCFYLIDMTLNPQYLEVIKTLYSRLHETDIVWVIGGSLALKLDGIDVHPKDIDLFTDEKGAYKIEELFAEFLLRKVSFSTKDNIRSHFGALNINGIEVEIIGFIEFQDEDGIWSVGRKLEDVHHIYELDEMEIPLMNIDSQLLGYRRAGRTEKIELVEKWLDKQDEINESELQRKIDEIVIILQEHNYDLTEVYSKDLINYFSFEAPTGDTTMLKDVAENKWLLVHEIVEISELKKKKLPLSIDVFTAYHDELYECHVTATEWEFKLALISGEKAWIRKRISLVDMWLEVDSMSDDSRKRCKNIIQKYSKL